MPNQKTTPQSKNNSTNYRQKIAPFRHYTNRTVQFATKVTVDFDRTIRQLAHEKQCLISEMLDNFMNAYLNQEKENKKNITKSKKEKVADKKEEIKVNKTKSKPKAKK